MAAAASPKEAARVRRGERREQLEARAKAIRAEGEAVLRMGELEAIEREVDELRLADVLRG